ncbi:LysR family transcriptional regulator [Celerinatantimonas sp. YJH-8]|uniref:LysR family transcriptional regulator n=1 Tax=Celerinatantimonas sp. YJH-8 TaxID=3228714 RepID=UPI0038CB0559
MAKSTNYSLGQVSDYELKQLRVFKTVVECGGFSAAETELNIGRSTISLHISNLESRLSLTLCRRGRAGFSLTDEGLIVYQMTQQLLDSLEEFRNTVNNLNSSLTGQLRLLLSDSISLDPRCKFPELVRAYCTEAPQIQLRTDVSSMAEIERRVLNDEADIGFIPYHRQLEGLNYLQLYSDLCYLYCSCDHELARRAPETICDDEINQAAAAHAGLKPHQQVNQQLVDLNLAATAYFYDVRLSLILSGHYIGFLPEYYAREYVEKGLLKAIMPERRFYKLGVAAVSRKTAQPHKPRELFWELLHRHRQDAR